MKFSEWFKLKLHINRFPLPSEIIESKYDYIINVSDEFIPDCHLAAIKRGIKYFWFPLSETNGDMGMNSIYGALQILFIAEQENATVLLHCHAGANRSPTVANAYYFMRTKTHNTTSNDDSDDLLNEWLGIKSKSNNRLFDNIQSGHLPAIRKLESFLIKCEMQFNKDDAMRGGGLDSALLSL